MKTLQLLLFALLLPSFLLAQIETTTELQSITIYHPKGAKIVRNTTVNVPAGIQTILLKDVEMGLDAATLLVTLGTAKASLLEVFAFQNALEKPTQKAEVADLQEQLNNTQDSVAMVKNYLKVLNDEVTILDNNRKLGSQQESINISEIELLAAQYRRLMLALRTEITAQEKLERRLKGRASTLNYTINNKRNSNTYRQDIQLVVSTKQAVNLPIEVSYMHKRASWTPLYDVKSKGMNTDLEIDYRAQVSNNTGKDWDDILLTLSTGKPLLNQTQVKLEPLAARIAPPIRVDTVVTFDPEAYEEQIQIVTEERYFEANNPDNPDFLFDPNRPTINSSPVDVSFTLPERQTIPANNRAHYLKIDELKIPAEYEYFSIPKLSDEVYLLARMTDYGQYNLVPGKANIFFADTYVGKTNLDLKTISDTLELSLGVAQGVQVRWTERDFTSAKVMGNNKRQEFNYEITVRNNLATKIPIRILDQVPISTNKLIEIELEKTDNANYDARKGQLTWQVNISPNKTETIRFSYRIKYPKDDLIEIVPFD